MDRFEIVSIRTTITRQSTRIIPFLGFLDQCNSEGILLSAGCKRLGAFMSACKR